MMDSQKFGRAGEEEPLHEAGVSCCAGAGHVWGRRAQMERERAMKRGLPKCRQRIWGVVWAANVILPSLCNAPTASSHK